MNGKMGVREHMARDFLEAAKLGDLNLIKNHLHNNRVSVDVSDLNGNTALFLAAVSIFYYYKINFFYLFDTLYI